MKIPSRKKSSRTPAVIATVVAVVVIACGLYVIFAKPFAPKANSSDQPAPPNTVNYGPATEQEKQDSANAKQNAVKNSENPPAPSTSVALTISRAGVVGTAVSVRTVVNGATTGNCTMTFTRNGQPTVTRTFSIAPQATSYVCNGDIPTSDFSVAGDWQLSIIANSGNLTSNPVTQTVTVTK